jgi:hypothetical protein
MPMNQPSLFTTIGAGLLKTAGAVLAFGYVYPHLVTAIAHATTALTHTLAGR